MKVSKDVFGNGCVRNIYSFLDLKMPKKVNLREKTLYNNIMQLTNTKNIHTNQKIWLTDRYLTYQYLNKIPYGNYNIIKNQINYDIQNIKQTKKDEEPKSAKIMSLKQAYDLYKKVIKFQDGIDKIICRISYFSRFFTTFFRKRTRKFSYNRRKSHKRNNRR